MQRSALRLLTQHKRCIKCGQPAARNALDPRGRMYEKSEAKLIYLQINQRLEDHSDKRWVDLVDDGEMDACIWAILVAIYPKFTVNGVRASQARPL